MSSTSADIKAAPRESRAPRVSRDAPKDSKGPKDAPKDSRPRKGPAPALPADALKISSESRPRSVAGAIAGSMRDGKTTSLNAIGAKSVYASIKSLIAARKYVVEDGFDIVIRPAQIDSVGPDAIRVDVEKVTGSIPEAAVDADNQLRLSASTKTGSLAGALSGKVRDGSSALCITGIGPTAVLRMVKAVALARSYTEKEGFDIYAAPRFVSLKVAGETDGAEQEERTGVRFDILVKKK